MRRSLMILASVIVLGACSDGPPPAAPAQGVVASFPPGAVVTVIRVAAFDALPLRAAELVAPDGTVTPASSLDVENNPRTTGGQSGVTDPWRSSMLGTNGTPQMPNATIDPTMRSQTRLMLMASTAEIPLPDPVAYRRDWANYRIRVSFAAAGGQLDTREIAAPAPPPG